MNRYRRAPSFDGVLRSGEWNDDVVAGLAIPKEVVHNLVHRKRCRT